MYRTLLQHLSLPHRITLLGEPTLIQRSRLPWSNFSLYYKRDDLTPYGLGGNKLRKLEFLMADALSQNANLILTTGGPQSNHARLTATVAAMLGIPSLLVISGSTPERWEGNLVLDLLAGAEIVTCGDEPLNEALARITEEKRQSGFRPYAIPLGGSNVLGALGYFLAFFELLEQCEEQGWVPSSIICPVGSAGMIAGLVAANALLPQPLHLVGISVWQSSAELRCKTEELASGLLEFLHIPCPLPNFDLLDEFIGTGYGHPTPEGLEVIKETYRTDGVLVDPVYTAKALAAVKSLTSAKRWQDSDHVVFWHTGGSPAIFTERNSSALLQSLWSLQSPQVL